MPDPDQLLPLFLLSDEPIGSHADSAFKDDPFARTVARAALGTKGPFTIGVYGGWGSGKTSALHAARTMIDADTAWSHIVTVEFNAWRYEREAHPIVPLVATIEQAIERKLADSSGISKNVSPIAVKGLTAFQGAARSLLSAFSLKLKPKLKIPFLVEVEGEVAVAPKDAIDRAEKDAERIRQAEERSKDADNSAYTEARDAALYLSMFDQLEGFLTSETDLAEADVTAFPRVVVFIDDLDRCQADKAFELLENVKLVLCQPGFVFVLALNHAVVDGYLTFRAEKLYGKDKAALHKSYLEKIVQLPLAIPSRSERFTGFAEHLLDTRLSKAADPVLREGLKKLAKVLALSANRTPRSLVRRINTALIDIALRDKNVLPHPLNTETGACPIFSGLCIVQRTLEAALGMDFTRALAQDNKLCEVFAQGSIWAIDKAITAEREKDPARRAPEMQPRIPVIGDIRGERAVPVSPSPTMQDPQSVRGWRELFDALYEATFLWWEDQDKKGEPIPGTSLLTSADGKRWLTNHEERRAIMRITVQRPDADASAVATEEKPGEGEAPISPTTYKLATSGFLAQSVTSGEKDLIEKAIRQGLQLPADAPLGSPELAGVSRLGFYGKPITDAGVAWLARADSGLTGLTELILSGTQVGDSGVAALASPDSDLFAITHLDLSQTQVGNDGVVALAAKNSGLKSLRELLLWKTNVGKEGAAALAAQDSGLTALTKLNLWCTNIGKAEAEAIREALPGLKDFYY